MVEDRLEYLCELTRGLEVLDVGVVEHRIDEAERDGWLHRPLCRAAKSCLGVDVLPEEVEKLRAQGFDVLCHDITRQPLERRFDLIVCGDVIEHLDSPGRLLAAAAEMLKPGGRVVLTCPNPWYLNAVLKNSLAGAPFVDNADHVAWFDPCTMREAGERCGLRLDRYAGVKVNAPTRRASAFFKLSPLLMRLGLRRELFAKTMLYEFKAVNGDGNG